MGRPSTLSYNPDGSRIAVGEGNTCRILDAKTGKILVKHTLCQIDDLAWRNDGRVLAIFSEDRGIHLFAAETGAVGPVMRGHLSRGLHGGFHLSDRLLFSRNWDGTLRVWDPLSGKMHFSLPLSLGDPQISDDGRILTSLGSEILSYKIDPAPAVRNLVTSRVSGDGYFHDVAVSLDGSIAAVAINEGLIFLDADTSDELAFLSIGTVWGPKFGRHGGLFTNGDAGLRKWQTQIDRNRKSLKIGPPSIQSFNGAGNYSLDESETVIASAHFSHCDVATPKGNHPFGPLEDCRGCSVSPDGKWLATSCHIHRGSIWDLKSRKKIKDFPRDFMGDFAFSPDGRLLVVREPSGSKILRVGDWTVVRELPALRFLAFSPDRNLMACVDPEWVVHLMDPGSGRTFAKLETPDAGRIANASFGLDGRILIINGSPQISIWNLDVIRSELSRMGLDWDLPVYSEGEDAQPIDRLKRWEVKVDLGTVGMDMQKYREMQQQVARYLQEGNTRQAIAAMRAIVRTFPNIANDHNNLAWFLATGPANLRDAAESLAQVEEALRLDPDNNLYLNTYGVALYRAGRYSQSIETLQKNLNLSNGNLAAFDLFFLAMANKRLARVDEARSLLKRAETWFSENRGKLSPDYVKELEQFQSEARAVLAPGPETLPHDVFSQK